MMTWITPVRAAPSLWLTQCAALAAVTIWATVDPLFESLVAQLSHAWSSGIGDGQWVATFGQLRLALLLVIAAAAGLSVAGLLIGMLGRSSGQSPLKSLRSLIALTAVVALWCGLIVNHHSIAWQGKRIRVAQHVEQLEALAEPLRAEFPGADGELPRLGPFMAYPFGTPNVLILLQAPCVGGDRLCVGAVQRGEQGDLKFQLTGTDGGDWAEWHPSGSGPRSFVGGLGDRHQLASSLRLGRGWHLVRYREDQATDQVDFGDSPLAESPQAPLALSTDRRHPH